jgi:four helix bundle protein
MNNIAEGFERMTDADFAHFLDIAKGSTGEIRSMYYAAEDLKYVPQRWNQNPAQHRGVRGVSRTALRPLRLL